MKPLACHTPKVARGRAYSFGSWPERPTARETANL